MAIEVHLLAINELRVTRENYGWLSFAEGKKYVEYQEMLAEGLTQDSEMYQNYLELLTQLEEEGKERMASDVMMKYFLKMPAEKQVQFLTEEIIQLEEKGKERVASDVMMKYFLKMPVGKQVQLIKELIAPDEVLQETLAELPPEKLQKIREIVLKLSPERD